MDCVGCAKVTDKHKDFLKERPTPKNTSNKKRPFPFPIPGPIRLSSLVLFLPNGGGPISYKALKRLIKALEGSIKPLRAL